MSSLRAPRGGRRGGQPVPEPGPEGLGRATHGPGALALWDVPTWGPFDKARDLSLGGRGSRRRCGGARAERRGRGLTLLESGAEGPTLTARAGTRKGPNRL